MMAATELPSIASEESAAWQGNKLAKKQAVELAVETIVELATTE